MTVPSTPGAVPLVSARGEATLEVEPEIVRLTVVVGARDKDRRQTLDKLARRNDECLTVIKAYGDAVEDLETSGLSVYPELRDRRGEKIRGYRGAVRVHLTVGDFTVLGDLVGRLGDLEMTSIDGPWWGLRRDSPVYRRARHEAARAAVTRAKEYAQAVGARLTGIVELADVGLTTDIRVQRFVPRRGLALGAPGDEEPGPPPIDLEPQTQVVEANVEARFTMSQPPEL